MITCTRLNRSWARAEEAGDNLEFIVEDRIINSMGLAVAAAKRMRAEDVAGVVMCHHMGPLPGKQRCLPGSTEGLWLATNRIRCAQL